MATIDKYRQEIDLAIGARCEKDMMVQTDGGCDFSDAVNTFNQDLMVLRNDY